MPPPPPPILLSPGIFFPSFPYYYLAISHQDTKKSGYSAEPRCSASPGGYCYLHRPCTFFFFCKQCRHLRAMLTRCEENMQLLFSILTSFFFKKKVTAERSSQPHSILFEDGVQSRTTFLYTVSHYLSLYSYALPFFIRSILY